MRAIFKILLAVASLMPGPLLWAQASFPSRPITIVVPFAAGGATDQIARRVAQSLKDKLGQPVVIDNRPGANGSIGAAYVAKARPDGYTILYGTSSTQAANVALFPTLSYDPVRDFAGLAMESEVVIGLFVSSKLKDLTLTELVERMKASPAAYPLGGSASTNDILDKQFRDGLKLDHTYVRYSSTPALMTDLLGGRLAGGWIQVVAGMPQVEAGKMHLIGIAASQRMRALPAVPLLMDVLPTLNFAPWTGYFVPAGTPQTVVELLGAALRRTFEEPDTLKLIDAGGRPVSFTPAQVDAFVRQEVPKWTRLVKSAGVTAN
ncbi:MAG: tripartite tricarboxylate transporter substrate binding protein [Burkholderiaceae bacterium]|nr:tripartite tricarboxylate transporter substrate binding protein [Burkholderiaceae bacterium]